MTTLTFGEVGEIATEHQIDLIAALDELHAITMYADGAAVPLTMIRIAARQLQPAIGATWARALEEAATSIEASLAKAKAAALRADGRSRAAMQAGDTFLQHHKAMEAALRAAKEQ